MTTITPALAKAILSDRDWIAEAKTCILALNEHHRSSSILSDLDLESAISAYLAAKRRFDPTWEP